jgi:zinc transport system permease protein
MNQIIELLEYDFFQKAIYASILTGLICGLIGTYIVAKRIVFISGGITHASFGGIGIAYFYGLSPLLGATIFAIGSALGIHKLSENKKFREDSLIGIFWATGMAIGILFIFMTPGYSPNMMSYLFGSILTVSYTQIYLMLALAIITTALFIFLFRPIFYIAFDNEYAQTHNLPVKTFNALLMCLVALAIVLSINVIGIILAIAYLTIPQAIANIFFKSFKSLLIASTIICPIGSLIGLIVSALLDFPSGATIIIVFVLIFLLAFIGKTIIKIVK